MKCFAVGRWFWSNLCHAPRLDYRPVVDRPEPILWSLGDIAWGPSPSCLVTWNHIHHSLSFLVPNIRTEEPKQVEYNFDRSHKESLFCGHLLTSGWRHWTEIMAPDMSLSIFLLPVTPIAFKPLYQEYWLLQWNKGLTRLEIINKQESEKVVEPCQRGSRSFNGNLRRETPARPPLCKSALPLLSPRIIWLITFRVLPSISTIGKYHSLFYNLTDHIQVFPSINNHCAALLPRCIIWLITFHKLQGPAQGHRGLFTDHGQPTI